MRKSGGNRGDDMKISITFCFVPLTNRRTTWKSNLPDYLLDLFRFEAERAL